MKRRPEQAPAMPPSRRHRDASMVEGEAAVARGLLERVRRHDDNARRLRLRLSYEVQQRNTLLVEAQRQIGLLQEEAAARETGKFL